jgi:hypothetical protein
MPLNADVSSLVTQLWIDHEAYELVDHDPQVPCSLGIRRFAWRRRQAKSTHLRFAQTHSKHVLRRSLSGVKLSIHGPVDITSYIAMLLLGVVQQ